jgi:hypothetical protein
MTFIGKQRFGAATAFGVVVRKPLDQVRARDRFGLTGVLLLLRLRNSSDRLIR